MDAGNDTDNSPETLFHYCSPHSFVEIVRNRELWLSSLTLSNDSMEGKVMSDVFQRILSKDSPERDVKDSIHASLKSFERGLDGLGFCLSADGDLLSQWRGYALDGQGFSIGFSTAYLKALSETSSSSDARFSLTHVAYTELEQESLLLPTYNKIRAHVMTNIGRRPNPPTLLGGSGDFDADRRQFRSEKQAYEEGLAAIHPQLFGAVDRMFALKGAAFCEEKEWRLVHYLARTLDDRCHYRASCNRVIPYKTVELVDNNIQEIHEVRLGPKNATPVIVIQNMLAQNGFRDVKVVESSATYR